ncbi:MAG: hypothetical protein KA538_09330 [Azonexus sp.]|jgi:hypothetical protein|nr:hypothetical protein [Azonexus sp.]
MLPRLVSRLLIMIMLLTVFSPSFGWESAGGMAAHEHPAVQVDEIDHGGGHDHGHDAHGDDGPAHADHAQAACDDAQHHCCPGHILGHMPGGLAAGLQLPAPDGSNATVDAPQLAFSSRIPEGLERPPRAAA